MFQHQRLQRELKEGETYKLRILHPKSYKLTSRMTRALYRGFWGNAYHFLIMGKDETSPFDIHVIDMINDVKISQPSSNGIPTYQIDTRHYLFVLYESSDCALSRDEEKEMLDMNKYRTVGPIKPVIPVTELRLDAETLSYIRSLRALEFENLSDEEVIGKAVAYLYHTIKRDRAWK